MFQRLQLLRNSVGMQCKLLYRCTKWLLVSVRKSDRVVALLSAVSMQWLLNLPCSVVTTFSRTYCIAGNVCENLILRFAVETEIAQFYSAQYYFHTICVGVIRKGSGCHVSMCTEAQQGMALFKYLSQDTSITKPSSSLLTVGVRYYMYTSTIIIIRGCARHGAVPKCKFNSVNKKLLMILA